MALLEGATSELRGRRAGDVRAFPIGTPPWIVALQRRIRGSISMPGMPNYESARAAATLRYSARPAAVVFCETEQDVRMSLVAAQDNGIPIRVRSGRHSATGYSNVDDGLVIDVRQIRHVTVDAAARTATVGAGANLGEVNAALDAHMLHLPAGGSWSSVGVGGFVQGGGYGWTARQYGMNCDRVAAVRVMLADGRVIRATRDRNAALLWAVCGGTGGNFGVLLDVTYDLAELYAVWGFVLAWPIEDAPRVLATMQEGFRPGGDAPDELGLRTLMGLIDGEEAMIVEGLFAGSRQAGVEALAPLTAIGACTKLMDLTDAYAVVNERLLNEYGEPGAEPGRTIFGHRSGYIVRPLGIDGWAAVVEQFKASPRPHNLVVVTPYGAQLARIATDACAFVHRAVDMNITAYPMWNPAWPHSNEEQAFEWANGLLDVVEPFRDGSVYQNIPERGLADYRTAYWGANFARLLAVKRIADPNDVFTHPQGITPDPANPVVVEQLPELEPEPFGSNGPSLYGTGLSRFGQRGSNAPSTPADRHGMATTKLPPAGLRQRLGELADLGRAGVVLTWDQQVAMPAGGAAARGAMIGSLQRLAHEKLVGTELSMLLAIGDPDDPAVRVVGREHQRARRVPGLLTEEIFRAGSDGMAAWLDARAHNDFSRLEPALRRNVELAREYAECFPEADHPYDALLDRYEPGATTARAVALVDSVCAGLAPLVADLATQAAAEPLAGSFPVGSQRAVARRIVAALGFDADSFRLDTAAHPFTCASTRTDVRVTARFEDGSLGGLLTFLHEMGHALYERGIDPALARTTLDQGASLGVHESQSLLWENMVGRGEAFWSWWLPHLREAMPAALGDIALVDFLRTINSVRPTSVRLESDEVAYALHILLRVELELRLVEGTLDPADVPEAWAQRTRELLAVDISDDVRGVLQDIHWAQGAIGYFPTYVIGQVLAAQLWEALRADVPCIDDDLRGGNYVALCDWLRDRVHRHGRALSPSELVAHAVGGPLDPGPLVAHLDARYRALYDLA
ncbi:MAG TPA: FAD-binding protein [Solirubrobacteraceae bacterium]|jgi:carboxypeptidase Taq